MKRLFTLFAAACCLTTLAYAEDQGRDDMQRNSWQDRTAGLQENSKNQVSPTASEHARVQIEHNATSEDPSKQPRALNKRGKPKGILARLASTNTMSIIAFVCGILALVSYYGTFLFGVLAIVLGVIALGQIRRTGEGGRTLAILAIIFGVLGLIYWPIIIFV